MKILSATGTAICTALLLCTLPTGGQQQEDQHTRSESGCKMGGHWESGCYEKIVESIPTVKGKAEYLARVADELQSQLETEKQLRELKLPPAGTYQIAVAAIGLNELPQIFRLDTRTGYVCRVPGSYYALQEGSKPSIPYCAN